MADTILDTFITLFEYKVEGADKVRKSLLDLRQLGQSMTRNITLPFLAFTGGVAKLASDMQETNNKIGESFKGSADEVREWSKGSIAAMGLAQQSALDTAALFGDIGTGIGLDEAEAAGIAMTLTQLTADLASFKNIRQSVAETALTGIFTGETESLKRLGIIITENNLKSFAMKNGLNANIEKMSALEKVSLRYKLVMDATANAQGDFVRTGGDAANQARMLMENFKEAGVIIGQTVLPAVTDGLVKLNAAVSKATEWWSGLNPMMQEALFIVGAVAAAIGPLIVAVASLGLALQFLWANPIGLVIAGIVAVISGLIILYRWLKKIKGEKVEIGADMTGLPDVNGTNRGFGSTLLPVGATPPAGLAPRSKLKQDNRVFNVDASVAVNEATDGRKVAKMFTEGLSDELQNTTQNFFTLEG